MQAALCGRGVEVARQGVARGLTADAVQRGARFGGHVERLYVLALQEFAGWFMHELLASLSSAPILECNRDSLLVRFSGAELLGGAGVGAPTLELANSVAHGGAGPQGHSTNIALGSWIWKPAPSVIRIKLLRLPRRRRQEARSALRVHGQVRERVEDV